MPPVFPYFFLLLRRCLSTDSLAFRTSLLPNRFSAHSFAKNSIEKAGRERLHKQSMIERKGMKRGLDFTPSSHVFSDLLLISRD